MDDIIRRLFEAGAHFGFSRSRTHPSARPYLYGFKNGAAVIDLTKLVTELGRAKAFLRELGAAGKTVLWVGNKDEARTIVADAASRLGHPYTASRWLGGTLTNWPQIKERLGRLRELKAKREEGGLAMYTKKERLGFDKEIARLERYFATLLPLEAGPAALVAVDSRQEEIAVLEARKTGVPVVSISGTDCNLALVDYPLVANDTSAATIKLLLEGLAAAYEEGKEEVPSAPPLAATAASPSGVLV